MIMATRAARVTDLLRHEALFYRGTPELLAGTVPFVEAALDAGEPALVAVPEPNLGHIRRALGARAAEVCFVDLAEDGRNPGRIIPFVLHAFVGEHPGRTVRIVGEPVWYGRSAAEYGACVQHELLVNVAFAGRDLTMLCPYDEARLAPAVLDDARGTHPVVVSDGRRQPSGAYGSRPVAGVFGEPLAPPSGPVAEYHFNPAAAPGLRRFLADRATDAGLTPERADDLLLAVNELTANTVRYADATGLVRSWCTPDHLVCEVLDGGRITDPLAGRVPATPDSPRGRGLLIVNYLCDLVQISVADGSTAVRVSMRR